MAKESVSRRKFIQGLGALSVAAGVPLAARGQPVSASVKGNRARNVILLVADGMGIGTLSLAHHWSLQERQRPLHWMDLYRRPGFITGIQDTASENSPVTDSAAAGSAWGSGQRVPNGQINVSASGEALKPIGHHARELGKRVGLVTTTRMTHATPATFIANVEHRDEEDRIADQYLERGVELLLGGGSKSFLAEEDGVDRISSFREGGYRICRNRNELNALGSAQRGQPLLGLFAEDHIPYAVDRSYDGDLKQQIPGLVEMARVALRELSSAPDGFLLQIEGGRVDHAGHANDPAAILHEQLEFDEVIAQALAFQQENPDTLLIVTTDHGTGGCQLDGVGPGYVNTSAALGNLKNFRMSMEMLVRRLEEGGPIAELLEKATSKTPETALVEQIRAMREKDYGMAWGFHLALNSVIHGSSGVGWSSHFHTSECVECLASGPGSDTIPSFFENRELFNIMTNAMG